jgi:uncharacterized protein (DUF2147 family)
MTVPASRWRSKGKKLRKPASYTRLAAALGLCLFCQAAYADDTATPNLPVIDGTWLTQAKSEITIAECPDGFCGDLSKIVVPEDLYKANKKAIDSIGATNFTDLMNKDPALRNRPILGLQIVTLHAGGKPNIYDGAIYNPQDGNTYSGYVEVLSADKIKLNGCILYNIICKGEEWTRVPQPASADATAAPAATAPAAATGSATPVAPGSFQ